MKMLFGKMFYQIANSSDICVMSRNSMNRISSNQYLELLLLDKSLNDLTI